MADPGPAPTTIRKYANRRMYDTAASRYVALGDLARKARRGEAFVVVDAKSGHDLTRTVLTQIIVEEESAGRGLLSVDFLRQLIGFHGDGLQVLLARYLDQTMSDFVKNQDEIRNYVSQAMASDDSQASNPHTAYAGRYDPFDAPSPDGAD